jgi:hypothetical protein
MQPKMCGFTDSRSEPNIFCGCLIGLVACSLFVFADQLRLGRRTALLLGLLWAVHPSVNWVALAAFMPQLVGVSMMLSLMAFCPMLPGRRSRWALGGLLGLLLCGLFVGYNELIPITGAAMGLSLLAVARRQMGRWKRIFAGAGVMSLCAVLLSPLGIYRGVLGMLLQIEIARRTGGSEQAVDQLDYLFGSWLGVLPLPPTREAITQLAQHPWYWFVQSLVLVSLSAAACLLLLGLRRCGRGRLVILPITLGIAVLLAIYIESSFDIPQFRTWALFKLTQYVLPIAALCMGLGVVRAVGAWRRVSVAMAMVLAGAILAQGVHFYSGFPRTSLHINQPRYGTHPTSTDMEFVAAVNRIVPAGTAVLGVNDVALVRNITPSLLLYPRKVLAPETPISAVFAQKTRYAVEDRNYPRVRALAGAVIWENERFSISELSQEQIYLTLADAAARLLGPESEIVLPSCKSGDTVALHGFAVDGGTLTIAMGKAAQPKVENRTLTAGEFILQVPVTCEADGAKTVLRTNARAFIADFELVKSDDRRRRLGQAAAQLSAESGSLLGLLPLLSKNGAWQVRQFDGSPSPPALAADNQGLRIGSATPVSGGLEAVVNVEAGWYELEAAGNVTRPLAGAGRGLGFGFLNLPDSQTWHKGSGPLTIRRVIQVPTAGPRGFGVILGGYGTIAGEALLSRLDLRPTSTRLSGSAKAPVAIPPWSDPAWSSVSYDGAKDLCERRVSGDSMALSSPKPTSSGMGTVIDLRPGTYVLGARIEATAAATGPGLGYAVLFEGLPDSIVSSKDAGTLIGERMFSVAKGGKYRLSTIVGGYGLSQGEAQFSEVRLARISDNPMAPRPATVSGLALPDLAGEGWRVVPLDPAPGAVDVRRGPGWIGLGSTGQISSAAVVGVSLAPGTYVLGADLVAEETANGNGKGYGVGFLQSQNYQWYVREAGSHRITALIMPEKKMDDSLALIVGGFGTVKGSARFSRPVLRPLRFSTLSAIQ